MGGGKSTAETVETPEADPTPTVEETTEATSETVRDEEASKLKRKRGMAGTVLTDPLGTTGTTLMD